jgi:hypothetical protein
MIMLKNDSFDAAAMCKYEVGSRNLLGCIAPALDKYIGPKRHNEPGRRILVEDRYEVDANTAGKDRCALVLALERPLDALAKPTKRGIAVAPSQQDNRLTGVPPEGSVCARDAGGRTPH